ncbi:hypothetical protein SAMN03084138_01102 [Enterovibrio norvegicus DSM 15893]|uniref:Uncharacterized protein n=1 Tax=Enterovibrio norvegicus DSM 15893 TaxID=1121869 RepID=A0A1I5LVI2_9GAMM|nr:hypothetical protein SAMN03084138_01102 [Enterovibrio norvegicus DSM 15893]
MFQFFNDDAIAFAHIVESAVGSRIDIVQYLKLANQKPLRNDKKACICRPLWFMTNLLKGARQKCSATKDNVNRSGAHH